MGAQAGGTPDTIRARLPGEPDHAPGESWLVGFWRDGNADEPTACVLHLEDWPAKGDAVRTEADCHSPWPEQAARLRALLDERFRPIQ